MQPDGTLPLNLLVDPVAFERALLGDSLWERERFGSLDEGLVSRDRRAIREKIETEPKIRKGFQDLTRLSLLVKI
jgi:hypothetical protein